MKWTTTYSNRLRGRLRKWERRSASLQKEWRQRWHNPQKQSQPIFLVGCGRSGTSMLTYHLGRSWRLDAYNENDAAAFNRWRLRDLETIDALVSESYAEFVLFKPILDTQKSQIFLSTFPTARVIFVFRHFDDVINSSMKKFGKASRLDHVNSWITDDFAEFAPVSPPAATKAYIRSLWQPSLSPESGAALYWLYYNRLYLDLHLDQDERVRLLRYESLTAAPEEQVGSLCDFLGLPFEEQFVEGIFSTSVGRNPAPVVDDRLREECEALWQELTERAALEVRALSGPSSL